MRAFVNEKNKKYDWAFRLVAFVVTLEVIFYIYMAMRGIGTVKLSNYMPILLNGLMFFSIVRYTVRQFKKDEDGKFDNMLFRFGMSILSAIIGLREGNNTVFICTAIMLFLVPYITGNWKYRRKQLILMLIVLVCAVIIAVITVTEPMEKPFSFLGPVAYGIDAFTQVVQWCLFFLLAYVRYSIIEEKKIAESAGAETGIE